MFVVMIFIVHGVGIHRMQLNFFFRGRHGGEIWKIDPHPTSNLSCMDILCFKRYKGFTLIQLPIHIGDLPVVQCSTPGAVDMAPSLKGSGTGSIPLASKARKRTCLESKPHVIDSHSW